MSAVQVQRSEAPTAIAEHDQILAQELHAQGAWS
jgi:hypothetical protein